MRVSACALTDTGRKRQRNEDSYLVNQEEGLFIVADGMGGHAAGQVAARIAVEAVHEFVSLTDGDEEITWPFGLDDHLSYDGNRLKTAVRHANRVVLQAQADPDLVGMATTVVAVLIDGNDVNLCHVGDSRAYLLRGRTALPLTVDHSWVNEQMEAGAITSDEAECHPLRNIVTRALGGRSDVLVDAQCRRMEAGDTLLLCSDGLTAMVRDEMLADLVTRSGRDLKQAARALVAAANAGGGADNITVLLIRFSG